MVDSINNTNSKFRLAEDSEYKFCRTVHSLSDGMCSTTEIKGTMLGSIPDLFSLEPLYILKLPWDIELKGPL